MVRLMLMLASPHSDSLNSVEASCANVLRIPGALGILSFWKSW